jgi:hypothetical protein
LNRRIFDLNREIVHKLNKLDACLQRCNIRISNYVSTIDSKSYKNVVECLCDGITDSWKNRQPGRSWRHYRIIDRSD